nr:hypothetical protein [uncultured Blautia sp.]
MKNTKKIIAMTIAFIMTGVMLAGCGNGVDHKDYMKDSDSVTASVDKDVEKDSDKKSETADKADTDKKDEAQSETEKKTDSADKADKDSTAETENQSNNNSSADNSSNTGNSGNAGNSNSGSVNKPNTGSGNSNTGNNGNHNGSVNKPSKPSDGNNSGNSGNNGNHNGNNKPAEKPSEPEKPAPHVHSYQVVSSTKGDCSHAGTVTKKCSCGKTITETGSYGDHNMVHHDAQGHDVTDYEVHAFCGGCGKDFGAGPAGAQAALEHTMMDFNDGCSNYYADEIAVGSHWEETSPAYDECSICGKR